MMHLVTIYSIHQFDKVETDLKSNKVPNKTENTKKCDVI